MSNNYDEIVNLIAETCRKLPWELVVEILCKLPVKSLIRFKTVCKPWKLLFDSHVFIQKHLHRKNPQISLYSLLLKKENPCFFPNRAGIIVGACNGIICLATYEKEKPLLLFNPSTREVREIYLQSERHMWDLGFCYFPKTHEYKIISFMQRHDNYNKDMRILTLGNNTTYLRDVEDVIVPGHLTRANATYGTSIFWIGNEYRNVNNDIDNDDIIDNDIVICYDAIEERFSKIIVPPSPPSPALFRSLNVLKDSLIMFVYQRVQATFFDIWTLIDDGSKDKSWMRYRKIGPLETSELMHPLDVRYDRYILCSSPIRGLFHYDLKTNRVNYKDDEVTYPQLESINYVESLVPINWLCGNKM